MADIFSVATRPGPAGEMQWIDKATGGVVFEISNGPGLRGRKVVITAAQLIAMGGSPLAPVTILPAPGAGMANYIIDAVLYLNFGTQAFTGGSAVTFVQGGITIFSTTAALVNNGSSILIQPAFPGIGTTASLGILNTALTANATAAFASGDGSLDVHVWYSTLVAP